MRGLMLALAIGLATGAMLVTAAATEKPELMTGTVISLDTRAMTLVARNEVQGGDAEDIAFDVPPGTLVRVHGMKGKLEQIKAGDVVTVRYVVKDRRNVATEIQHM